MLHLKSSNAQMSLLIDTGKPWLVISNKRRKLFPSERRRIKVAASKERTKKLLSMLV